MLDEHLGYRPARTRLQQFRAAIAAIVRPGDTVDDRGCGSGILGLLCLQAGAGHVFGIDGKMGSQGRWGLAFCLLRGPTRTRLKRLDGDLNGTREVGRMDRAERCPSRHAESDDGHSGFDS